VREAARRKADLTGILRQQSQALLLDLEHNGTQNALFINIFDDQTGFHNLAKYQPQCLKSIAETTSFVKNFINFMGFQIDNAVMKPGPGAPLPVIN
jgi:hypothetical protein